MEESRFAGTSDIQDEKRVGDNPANANELVVVSLWAVLERELMQYLQLEGQKLLQRPPSKFNTRVHQKIESDMEYWRSGDVLDLFKSVVDSVLIGKAKQVNRYRDWLVHKNPKKVPPEPVSPNEAYQTLRKLISTVEHGLMP